METMIPVESAFDLLNEHTKALQPISVPLQTALNLVLAEDVFASDDFPSFLQSNMDGYAFAFEQGIHSYALMGEMAAGETRILDLPKGKAVRIFTGAALPKGADTVLIQEKAKIEEGKVIIEDADLKLGHNTRPIGSEIRKGALALSKGTVLKPSTIGYLAGLGIENVLVFPRPKVGIIITGNELQSPGSTLSHGQVFESNSYGLITALQQLYIEPITIMHVKDQLNEIAAVLSMLLHDNDLILMTGGVSVGDYDFTLKAFEQSDVIPYFHKIKQKPGKPLLFGKKEEKIVFGLPGNPSSVLTCFYMYVRFVIGKLMQQSLQLNRLSVPITHDFVKPEGLTHFVKAIYHDNTLTIPTGQESYKLSSFASANCLAEIPANSSHVAKGSYITIHVLP